MKTAGDRLLPITAEEESKFPTLQEAEEMSNQQIKFTHKNRNIPKVDNPIWKATPEHALPAEATSTPTPTEIDDELQTVQCENEEFDNTINTTPSTQSQSYIGHKIPEDFLIKAGLIGNDNENDTQVQPLYKLNADGNLCGLYFYVLLKTKIDHRNSKMFFFLILLLFAFIPLQTLHPKSMRH